jgi:hypothetical protein
MLSARDAYATTDLSAKRRTRTNATLTRADGFCFKEAGRPKRQIQKIFQESSWGRLDE